MSLHVQVLQDVPPILGVDHIPLYRFMQWVKEHDTPCNFANHYNLQDGGATIVDFGLLKEEIESFYNDAGGMGDPAFPPPDIREWLQTEINAGRVLAWVRW